MDQACGMQDIVRREALRIVTRDPGFSLVFESAGGDNEIDSGRSHDCGRSVMIAQHENDPSRQLAANRGYPFLCCEAEITEMKDPILRTNPRRPGGDYSGIVFLDGSRPRRPPWAVRQDVGM